MCNGYRHQDFDTRARDAGCGDPQAAVRVVFPWTGCWNATGPYTFVAADALVLQVRGGGRVVNIHALLAAGVNADGHGEILGLQVTSAEDGAGWLAFFRDPPETAFVRPQQPTRIRCSVGDSRDG